MIRIMTLNNHDQFREYKQFEKSIVDLSIRFFSKQAQKLFISFLNENNEKMKKIYKNIKKNNLEQKNDDNKFNVKIKK